VWWGTGWTYAQVGCAYVGQGIVVGAGLPREAGRAVYGTGWAGVRGASPLPQSEGGLAGERGGL